MHLDVDIKNAHKHFVTIDFVIVKGEKIEINGMLGLCSNKRGDTYTRGTVTRHDKIASYPSYFIC